MTSETAASARATAASPRTEPLEPAETRETSSRRARPAWTARFGLRLSALYLWVLFMALFGLIAPGTFLTAPPSGSSSARAWSPASSRSPSSSRSLPASTTYPSVRSCHWRSRFRCISRSTPASPVLGAVIAFVACVLCGFVSGFIVVRLRVNSFIATLGVGQILFAVVLLISGNQQLTGTFPSSWSKLGNSDVPGSRSWHCSCSRSH